MSALSVDIFLYINLGVCFCLLYLIKIFKMAAELYKGVMCIDCKQNIDSLKPERQLQTTHLIMIGAHRGS